MIKLRVSPKTISFTLASLTEAVQNCTTYSIVGSLAQEYFQQSSWDGNLDQLWATIGFLAIKPDVVLDVAASSPYIELLQAWAKQRQGATISAQYGLPEGLNEVERLVASCALAELQQAQKPESWYGTLEGLSSKLYLGSFINYTQGMLHMQDGNHAQALKYFDLARMHMADSYWKAVLYHAVGWAKWYQGDIAAAEANFSSALVNANKSRKPKVQAQAYLGLAALQLENLELSRAHFSYSKAAEFAQDDDHDQQQALWGQALVLRLMGEHAQAYTLLQQAIATSSNNAWLLADIAACLTLEGRESEARQALAQYQKQGHGAHQDRSQALVSIVKAQLEGAAVPQTLKPWLKQEALCFSVLQDHHQAATANLVQVQAAGALQVRVNGRLVSFGGLRRAEELLVLLVDHDGRISQEQAIKALFPKTSLERGRKSLYPHIIEVKNLLGWDSSLTMENGILVLDTNATWLYDIHNNPAPAGFMSSHFTPWIMQRRQELGVKDAFANLVASNTTSQMA